LLPLTSLRRLVRPDCLADPVRCYQNACAWVNLGRSCSKLRLWEHTARYKERLIPRRQIIKSIASGLKLILKLSAVSSWTSARDQQFGRPLPKYLTLNEITNIFCLFVSGPGLLDCWDGRGFTVLYKDFLTDLQLTKHPVFQQVECAQQLFP
jgi:hypothetical protein